MKKVVIWSPKNQPKKQEPDYYPVWAARAAGSVVVQFELLIALRVIFFISAQDLTELV